MLQLKRGGLPRFSKVIYQDYSLYYVYRHVFLPLKMDRDNDGRKDIIPVPAGENLDLHLKSFIREHHRENFVPVIIPALTAVRNSAKEGKLIE